MNLFKNQKKDDEKKRLADALDLKTNFVRTFSSEEGTKVLQYLVKTTDLINPPFNPNPNTMYYEQGKRAIVQYIINVLDMDLDKYRQIMESSFNIEDEN